MYVYPAMLAHAQTMHGHAATLQAIGGDIGAEQSALAATWIGDTGATYQSWQAQWNEVLQQLTNSYRAMAQTHEENTQAMLARDSGEGAKWGGPVGV